MVKIFLVISLAFLSFAVFCFEGPAQMIRAPTEDSISGTHLLHPNSLEKYNLYSKKTDRTRSVPEIKQNWKKSQGELESLEKDFNELSDMCSDLRQRFQSLGIRKQGRFFILSDSLDIDTFLRDYRDMLAVSTKLKLLQLGKTTLPNSTLNLIKLLDSKNVEPLDKQVNQFSDLPEEMREIIATKAWKSVWDNILPNFKQLMTTKANFYTHFISLDGSGFEMSFLLLWQYIFKSIDFLLKNDIAGPSTIRSFFQDTEILKQVIIYVEHSFAHAIQDSALVGSYQLTKHWYWPLLHDSFKVLSKREEDMFNAHILLDFRFNKLREELEAYSTMPQQPGSGWMHFLYSFFGSFNAQKYLEEFKAINEAKKPNYEDQLHNKYFTEMINKNVEELINLIVITGNKYQNVRNFSQSEILIYLCDVLNFIDQYISPGIIERFSSKHPNYDNFDMRYNIIRLDFSMAYLAYYATRYYSYIQMQSPMDWSKTKLYQIKFNSYLNQLNEKYNEFKEEESRIMPKLHHLKAPVYLEYFQELTRIKDMFQSAINLLQHISTKFSP